MPANWNFKVATLASPADLPEVAEGMRWAAPVARPGLPQAIAVNTPHMTARAHPVVMTSHPEFSALLLWRRTPALTPLPRRIRTKVPLNSPNQGVSMW